MDTEPWNPTTQCSKHWFPYTTRWPPAPAPLLSIQPLNCPQEEGEGRYESTYLLAFVQRTALSVRVLELLTSSPAYLRLLELVS